MPPYILHSAIPVLCAKKMMMRHQRRRHMKGEKKRKLIRIQHWLCLLTSMPVTECMNGYLHTLLQYCSHQCKQRAGFAHHDAILHVQLHPSEAVNVCECMRWKTSTIIAADRVHWRRRTRKAPDSAFWITKIKFVWGRVNQAWIRGRWKEFSNCKPSIPEWRHRDQ